MERACLNEVLPGHLPGGTGCAQDITVFMIFQLLVDSVVHQTHQTQMLTQHVSACENLLCKYYLEKIMLQGLK
jgi:hypothetical protein